MVLNSIEQVLEKIEKACDSAGRNVDEVSLLPVSKGHSVEKIQNFLMQNLAPKQLGESYLNELIEKTNLLKDRTDIAWHYLGRLQSKKIKEIVNSSNVVHSVSRIKELECLASLNLKEDFRFYLQFNVSKEESKGGFALADQSLVKEKIDELSLGNRVLGLMTLASPVLIKGDVVRVEQEFASLCELRNESFSGLGLSMGMSSDYECAIKHGATCLRIGSALFGERV